MDNDDKLSNIHPCPTEFERPHCTSQALPTERSAVAHKTVAILKEGNNSSNFDGCAKAPGHEITQSDVSLGDKEKESPTRPRSSSLPLNVFKSDQIRTNSDQTASDRKKDTVRKSWWYYWNAIASLF